MVAYGIWDPVAQFESDISNRGIFYQMEDGRAHNPEVAGSNPAPATQRIMIRRKTNVICNDQRIKDDTE